MNINKCHNCKWFKYPNLSTLYSINGKCTNGLVYATMEDAKTKDCKYWQERIIEEGDR